MPTLSWLGKKSDIDHAKSAPYRLLEDVPELGFGDANSGNMLIHGDNLEALKALLPYFSGQIECIYIDPPFNTGQAFEHYDDNVEHSIWLGLMYSRLELLRELLSESGTIAVHLDDEELGYCIALMDEIFGRKNRINLVTFKQGAAVGHKAINPGLVTVTNFVVIYAKNKAGAWRSNRVFTPRERDARYANFISNYEEKYEDWQLIPLSKAFAQSLDLTLREAKKKLGDKYSSKLGEFVLKHADRVVQPVPPAYEGVGQETRDMIDLSKENPERVYLQTRRGFSDIFVRDGKRWLFYKDKLKQIDGELVAGEPLTNLWDDLLSNNLHNEGGVKFPKGKKPEALIKRILELYSQPGDYVLDSFLGSGTTVAVAQKMGRRYIGVEMGEHAVTHCLPRLKGVVEGDQGGVSKAVSWHGGGGFQFLKLGPPVFDETGQICADIKFPVLAAHVWFSETGIPCDQNESGPLLGVFEGHAYALLYNGILGDKKVDGGNVLTRKTLGIIRDSIRNRHPDFDGALTIYGELSRLGAGALKREAITFKQTPYDVKARA